MKYVLLFFLIIPKSLIAQSDQWLQHPPKRWCTDQADTLGGESAFNHCFDNANSGCDYMIFHHDALLAGDSFSLSFRVRHGFDPSSQNNWQVMAVTSFRVDPEQIVTEQEGAELQVEEGMVLGVNYGVSDDLVKIWGVTSGDRETWCSTQLNYQAEVGTVRSQMFRLVWDGKGELALYGVNDPGDGTHELLGSCQPEKWPGGRYLVFRYQYSSSRDRALWFDRVKLEGHFMKDTLAPVVTAARVIESEMLGLSFSEKIPLPGTGSFSLVAEQFPGDMKPDSLYLWDGELILLFSSEIPNRLPFQLRIREIADQDGNLLQDTLLKLMRNEGEWGDVVFNEVMADPSPAVHYGEEYLELLNRSGYNLELKDWKLRVNQTWFTLSDALMEEGSKLDAGEMGLVTGINLPNEGAILSLYSGEGELIHAAFYRVPWNGADWKKEGGWSLESPDPEQLCIVSYNWVFSSDPGGGTPGRVNSQLSISSDDDPPKLLYGGLESPGCVLFYFSEPVRLAEETAVLMPGAYGQVMLMLLDPMSNILRLCFSENFGEWGSYRIRLPAVEDCSGNSLEAVRFKAGVVAVPGPGSALINEIMFHPEEGKPEYIELYLPGEEVLDLQELSLHVVEEGAVPDQPVPLSDHSRLFLPGQYLVLTRSVLHLMDAYQLELSGSLVEVEKLPAMKSSGGSLYLTDRAGNVVEMVHYNADMHMDLITDQHGISLERVSATRPGSDPGNWHSAASIAGYATPGKINSQSAVDQESDGVLVVGPKVFSPDNDSYEDLLQITISPGGQDWLVGLWITDLKGNRIRVLANNHLCGPSVIYSWDGESDSGAMQPVGIYVIHAQGYHSGSGERWIRKRAVGLVYR